MYRIRPDTGEIFELEVFEGGTYAGADPSFGKERHHLKNRVVFRSLDEVRAAWLKGWPIWMRGRTTAHRNLVSKGIIDAPAPRENPNVVRSPRAPMPTESVKAEPREAFGDEASVASLDLDRFMTLLHSMTVDELESEIERPRRLLISSHSSAGTEFSVAWAPFEYVNPTARIVIIGLTPGRRQMRDALFEAHRALREGAGLSEAIARAKVYASFAGQMRSNLVKLLDATGVPDTLGIKTSAALWSEHAAMAHFTSLIRYPVFANGDNYGGTPDPNRVPWLIRNANIWLAEELYQVRGALVVPMGEKVSSAVSEIAKRAGIDGSRILDGFPHASAANNGPISRFLGAKGEADPWRRRFRSVRTKLERLRA
ncbi:hypothetical protein [Mesorhizobium sp. CAU 1732]|uniref:hypothetical protein n=1 Tax=Mesorhizobium sp. CAU 1732 TaxID=3140358 RepID=UPI0032614A02